MPGPLRLEYGFLPVQRQVSGAGESHPHALPEPDLDSSGSYRSVTMIAAPHLWEEPRGAPAQLAQPVHARLMCLRFSALTGRCSGELLPTVDDCNAPYSVRKEVGTD